jgi:anti-sigma B factor antagonist
VARDLATFFIDETSGVPTIVVDGQIDLTNADLFKKRMLDVHRMGDPALAVDLSHCDYIDSSGLSALISVRKRIGAAYPLVVHPDSHIRRLLSITRLDALFPLYDDRASLHAALLPAEEPTTLASV